MKTWFYLLIAICLFPQAGSGQGISDISRIRTELTEELWIDHSIHEMNGYTIKMVFGESRTKYRHTNLGDVTAIEYLDQDQLLDQLKGSDFDSSQVEILRPKYEEARGGAINLYITRGSQSDANFKWFFIVIRGEDDWKKIMEIDLEYQPSQLPEGKGWWNYTTVFLPEPLATPFYVYVNDRHSGALSDFKFLVRR
ncbi:MAG TPA: hypothetical protein VK994_00725 [Bacteroidales bacterium]|nr:hypothetical protein [Bacteroidales bacterium]